MPKNWKRQKTWRKNRNKEKDSIKEGTQNGGSRPDGWSRDPILKENKGFETYYKSQGIVPEEEFESFMDALRRQLPHSFRLVGCRRASEVLLKVLEERYFNKVKEIEVDGQKVEPPKVLPWYPNGLGFQMTLPRQVLRKQVILNSLHNFLVTETELGNVSRQETVSMLPPLLLDVQPHHRVLDMCAAPGSKTGQIIEMLHANNSFPCPSGLVVANDADNRRCYMLVHQSLKRLQNACCIVVNHDAATMPSIYLSPEIPKEEGVTNIPREVLDFDRILCDVPCSGDGTMRKNLDVWKSWNVNNAFALHKLQFRIAKRGLELLKVGGRMVYSTCSLNPVEDEAVIYRLLEYAEGSVDLVDVSGELPGLIRSKGLSSWKVMDRDGIFYEDYEQVPQDKRGHMARSVMPGSPDEMKKYHLDKAFRILPHHQDTGGFFVAVLQKTKPFPWVTSREHSNSHLQTAATEVDTKASSEDKDALVSEQNEISKADNPASNSPPRKSRKKNEFQKRGFKEAPFVFMDQDDGEKWKNIEENYGVGAEFPFGQVFFRCEESITKRNLYLVNAGLKKILTSNPHLNIINAGLRIFGRVEQKQQESLYRMVQDGIDPLLPYLTKRIVEVDPDTLATALQARSPRLSMDEFSKETQEKLRTVPSGSVALWTSVEGHKVALCIWKGALSVTPYVEKPVKLHILRMLGHDTTSLEEEMISKRKIKKSNGNGETSGDNDKETVTATTDEQTEPQEPIL